MGIERVRGRLIVLDGGEGCGKSTQAKMLHERLEAAGLHPLLVHDPGTTRIGGMIRQILLDPENTDMGMRCEMLLYMAARAQMMWETIRPAREAGRPVISDRFVSSTLAYQLGGDGITEEEIHRVAGVALKGAEPDLTIILDMPIEISSRRVQPKYLLPFPEKFKPMRAKDRIEQRSLDYHDQVRRNYLAQAKADPAHYRVIAADGEPQAVHEEVWKTVTAVAESGA
jgi:dTMP kinase